MNTAIRRKQLVAQSLSALILLACLFVLKQRTPVSVNDFAAYWSAARLLLHHNNPYATGPVRSIEEHLGRPDSEHLIMLNPPWALPLALPTGLLPFRIAQTLWLWASILITLYSVRLLWTLYAGAERVPSALWLVIALFLPMYVQFAIGQIGAFVLLGIAGFLYAQYYKHNVMAGLSLFLIALKPHLAFLIWVILVLWILQQRKWRIAWTFAIVMSCAVAIACVLDASVFQHYSEMWATTRVIWNKTPTFSGFLCYLMLSRRWIAFIPFWIALVWGILYWRKHRKKWDWIEQTPLLLLVSVAASPYSWFFDQIILIPAIVQLTAERHSTQIKKPAFGFLAYVAINLAILSFSNTHNLLLFAWTAPAWLVLYVVIRRRKNPEIVQSMTGNP